MADENRIGDAPIEPKHVRQMNTFADVLDDLFNEGKKGDEREVGFCLMVFPFAGFEGRANYVSNAQRADVVKLLKEQIARFEAQTGIRDAAATPSGVATREEILQTFDAAYREKMPFHSGHERQIAIEAGIDAILSLCLTRDAAQPTTDRETTEKGETWRTNPTP